jgi:hypothetical protein
VLLSVTFGKDISMQIGCPESGFKKLHSFFVAAEAACSIGDLPVVTVDARPVAVTGLATAAVATAPPAELAVAEPEAPTAAMGAIQACNPRLQKMGSK